MFRGAIVKGVAMGIWMAVTSVGCTSTRVQATRPGQQVTYAQKVPANNQDEVVKNFRNWLGRDVGWSQDQRLRRIERDWMSTLSQLPSFERREAADAIEAHIKLRRLHPKRDRIVRRLLVEDRQVVADATVFGVANAP